MSPEPESPFPLSPMQEGMLFNSVYAPGSGVDLLLAVVELPEDLDDHAFRQAWAQVIAHHPALRSSLEWEGLPRPLQRLLG
jgi:hypothetical protein